MAGLSNTGVVVTVPSPGSVNVYGNYGKALIAQVSNLVVDTATDSAGGLPNPFNRIVGCNASGDIKVIGQSSSRSNYGDWGYWDLRNRAFVDVSAVTQWGFSPAPPIVKLWSISDNDEICVSVSDTVDPATNWPFSCNILRIL